MTKFFQDLLLEQQAIYTLWGSKPVTRVILYEYPEEEIQAYLQTLSKEEINSSRIVTNYDLPENWKKWEKVQNKFHMHRYLLFEAKWQREPNVKFIYLVDILQTAILLQENYELFRKAVGSDFDPLAEVLRLNDDKNPTFFSKIESNALLSGLLFGYGKENVYAYHWKHRQSESSCESFFKNLQSKSSNTLLTGSKKRTLRNLTIPSFISFDSRDTAIKKFESEKREIQKQYRGKDFLETTLNQLTRS